MHTDQIVERTEFGFGRTSCDCRMCQLNCEVMPGFLIPADLERMIPAGADPFLWAAANLLASPGALVQVDDVMFRIPTLVVASKPDGSCIHLGAEGHCGIHAVSPFGCAFFDCGPERGNISHKGLYAVLAAWRSGPDNLYVRIWLVLDMLGMRREPVENLRQKMALALERETGVDNG